MDVGVVAEGAADGVHDVEEARREAEVQGEEAFVVVVGGVVAGDGEVGDGGVVLGEDAAGVATWDCGRGEDALGVLDGGVWWVLSG